MAADGQFRELTITSAGELCGLTKESITGLKYRNERRNARELAYLLVALVPPGVELLTWAPTAESRRMRRGMDHAELITRHLSAAAGIPARRLLRRLGESQQTGHDRAERRSAPAFVASRACSGRHVLVIDDVVTTGSTLVSACAALIREGAAGVSGLTVAAVP